MHAVEIAELLGVKSVFVPPDPGVAAAWGVYIADIVQEFSSAIGLLEKEICLKKIAQGFENLIVRANSWANDNSVNFNSCSLVHKLDLRYEGMTHESTVECGISNTAEQLVENALNSFHSQFEESTGRVWRDKEPVEVVNLRISLVATRPKALPNLPLYQPDDATPVKGTRRVGFLASEELIESIVYNRKSLSIGTTVKGPAVIEQADTTTILPPKWEALVDMHGNLLITEV
jgi:N-methylhydantoinase A